MKTRNQMSILLLAILFIFVAASVSSALKRGAPESEEREEYCADQNATCQDEGGRFCDWSILNGGYKGDLGFCLFIQDNKCDQQYGLRSDCLTIEKVDPPESPGSNFISPISPGSAPSELAPKPPIEEGPFGGKRIAPDRPGADVVAPTKPKTPFIRNWKGLPRPDRPGADVVAPTKPSYTPIGIKERRTTKPPWVEKQGDSKLKAPARSGTEVQAPETTTPSKRGVLERKGSTLSR